MFVFRKERLLLSALAQRNLDDERGSRRMTLLKSLANRNSAKWAALVVVFLAFFSTTLFYPDTMATNGHALLLLDCIADGRFFDFYTESEAYADNTWGFPANYLLPIYVIFAVWDLPIWFLIQMGVLGEMPVAGVIWSKFLAAGAWVGCVIFTYKLLSDAGNAKKGFWIFFLCSSPIFFLTPTSGFYDSIELLFGLWGFCRLSRDSGFSIKTLLILSLSISIKSFMLFPILLWLLVFEKRFLRLLGDILILASVSVLSVVPFLPSYFSIAGSFSSGIMKRFFSVELPADMFPCSLFFLGYSLLCICAFCMRRPTEIEDYLAKMGWITTAYFLVFIVFVSLVHAQWTILAMPFITLLLASNKANYRASVIIMAIWEIALLAVLAVCHYWVLFAPSLFEHMALAHVEPLNLFTQTAVDPKVIVDHFGLRDYLPGVMGVFIACSSFVLMCNIPDSWRKSERNVDVVISKTPAAVFESRTEWIRVAILGLIYIGYILLSFVV